MSGETTRNYHVDYNQVAVSLLLKETALNVEQTLSHSLMVSKGDIIDLDPRRESNKGELTGMEEPDVMYDLGNFSNATFNFEKAKTQDLCLAYGYGFGSVTPTAWGTGVKQLILPTMDQLLPGFTAAQRYGRTIFKRRHASMFVDTVVTTFARDTWLKCVAGIKGTGKHTTNMEKETVSAPYNAASLALAANGVQGSTPAERLASIHQIRVQVPTTGEWAEVAFSAVSSATPAEITITPPGGTTGSCTYEVLYTPIESGWMSFPVKVDEPALRVTDLVVKIGGRWNGTAFLGGRTLDMEINSIEHSLNNQMKIQFRPGGTGIYANYAERGSRIQTLKLDREMREYILKQRMLDNEYLGVYLRAAGAEFEPGKNYYVEMVFPRCGVLKAPITSKDEVLAEAGEIEVLQDATYGSARVEIGTKIATVAA